MSDYFDRQGKPLTMEEWASMFEQAATQDDDIRRVARTETKDSSVSTVWLGLDHSWGDGPPLIFETLVFGGPLKDTMERYSTEAAALAGHDQMVMRVRDAEAGLEKLVSMAELTTAVATINESMKPLLEQGMSRDDLLTVIFDTLTKDQS